jgi:hypothetical protein
MATADHLHAVANSLHSSETGQHLHPVGAASDSHAHRSATELIQDVFGTLPTTRPERPPLRPKSRRPAASRKVLVRPSDRHLNAISAPCGKVPPPFVFHGRLSRKQRAALIAQLNALPPDAPRVLLATGKLIGEGFDHPPLDTLILAMPVSWKGTLQQYAGRLHREHVNKTDVRIIDFVDNGHPALMRMWDKRQRGYRAMGYSICSDAEADGQQGIESFMSG